MINEVQCWRTPGNGIQLVFMGDHNTADVFEFTDPRDVDYIMSLIRIQVPHETLLVEARDRVAMTVH